MKIRLDFTLQIDTKELEDFWRAETGSRRYFDRAAIREAQELVRAYVRSRGEADLDVRLAEIREDR